jgi:hypothetical protein
MEESVAGPIRELDKAEPLISTIPFHFARDRRGGWFGEFWFSELWLGQLQRDLGIISRVEGLIVLADWRSSLINPLLRRMTNFPIALSMRTLAGLDRTFHSRCPEQARQSAAGRINW